MILWLRVTTNVEHHTCLVLFDFSLVVFQHIQQTGHAATKEIVVPGQEETESKRKKEKKRK